MSFSKLSNKRLLLIGPPGHGKSRTSNSLIGANQFAYGDKRGRFTLEMQIETHIDGLSIIDMPG